MAKNNKGPKYTWYIEAFGVAVERLAELLDLRGEMEELAGCQMLCADGKRHDLILCREEVCERARGCREQDTRLKITFWRQVGKARPRKIDFNPKPRTGLKFVPTELLKMLVCDEQNGLSVLSPSPENLQKYGVLLSADKKQWGTVASSGEPFAVGDSIPRVDAGSYGIIMVFNALDDDHLGKMARVAACTAIPEGEPV